VIGQMDDALNAEASRLLAASVSADAVSWFAHRTASPRALALLDVAASSSDDPHWLAAAGYARGIRATTLEEVRRAASQLARAAESVTLANRQQVLLAQLLVLLREDELIAELLDRGRLARLSEKQLRMLQADLANPFRTPGLPEQEWLRAIAPLFGDLSPVELGPPVPVGEGEPLDRLTADVEPGSARGDLVSVIVSSYRPGPGLETAVRSILAQTWADLEVLVVDDASGREFWEVYDRVESLDERVRVLHQPTNAGTYVARNTAVDQARGTYVTFQDSDDWSHPQRIERQVAVLAQEPLVHCVRAVSLSTPGSLVFSRQGTSVRAPAAATLMFRRQQVWPALGGFDVVRKAADTEFHLRIGAALPGYGVDLDEPLMWVRLGEGSLSRSEFRARWRHPARMLYRSAYSFWHEQLRRGESPRLDRRVRSFPAPRRFHIDQSGPAGEYDLVVLGDWRGDGNAARDAVEWVRLLAADGVRVALVHVESLNVDGWREPALMPSVQQLVADGTVEAVPWDESLTATAIVALEPEVLSFLPDSDPGARADAVVVLLDGAHRSPGSLATAEQSVRSRWGSRLVWSPRGGAAAGHVPVGLGNSLAADFPRVMPGEVRRPLHHAEPVVLVAPIGLDPRVLDDTASVCAALAEAGLDVRIRLASGLHSAMRERVGSVSPRILWADSASESAAAEVAIATDLVVIGPADGIDFHRMVDDARMWDVRTHHRMPGDTSAGADDASLTELVERIQAGRTGVGERPDPAESRHEAEAAVRAWYREVVALG